MREILIMAAEPSAKAKQHISLRVKAGQCLCCESKALKRGLCSRCYYKWRTERSRLTTNALRAAFDSKLIRIGKLLIPQDARKFKASDVFSSVASEVSAG